MLKPQKKTRITAAVMRSYRCLVLIGLSGFLWSCGTEVVPVAASPEAVNPVADSTASDGPVAGSSQGEGPARVRISDQVKPSLADVPGFRGGPARAVSAAVGPNGELDEYVQNEVVFQPVDQADLDEFVTSYAG